MFQSWFWTMLSLGRTGNLIFLLFDDTRSKVVSKTLPGNPNGHINHGKQHLKEELHKSESRSVKEAGLLENIVLDFQHYKA